LCNEWCRSGVCWAGAKTPVLATLADLDATLTDIETAFAVATFSTGDHSVIDAIQAASAAATTAVTALGTNFPESANVPEGSIAYAYDNGTSKFVWQAEPVVGSGSNKVAVSSICKPASLNYFVNTPARATSDMNVGLDQAPYNTVATWDGQWDPSTGAHKGWDTQVTSASRTVALEKNINYSVARLDLSVVAEDNRSTDNAQVLAGITDNDVVINNKLTVTGVLIGGQPNYVGWDLLPTTAALTAPAGAAAPFNAATAYDQTVWDKTTLGAGNVTTTATKFMSTLVLDNNAAAQKDVLIAVEFVNNTGIDFYGCNGIIKAGAKFYMVAQLHPESTLPNYNALTCNHVFVQDHITKVTARIAADGGLKHAYNNIPDLRSTELELGLSVDLEWQDGLEFSVDFQ
ncbi:MAG: hypothetical protein MJZ89_04880, partial [Paludibacteraceae bacterium]|nr:hypothetical protein [Paludibacteraceae bacterium]